MTDLGETGAQICLCRCTTITNFVTIGTDNSTFYFLHFISGRKRNSAIFSTFLTDLDKIRHKMSQSGIASLMDRKSRVYVQTTPLSSMSTYTLHPSLHCPCTHHTTLFIVYVHITPMSSIYVHTPQTQSSLAAYKHTVFTVYLHTGPLSSQSTYTPDHCLHSPRTHHNSVFTICVKKHTHTHTYTVSTFYVHTTTLSSPLHITMCKARTTLNMAGEGSFESAQFFLSC